MWPRCGVRARIRRNTPRDLACHSPFPPRHRSEDRTAVCTRLVRTSPKKPKNKDPGRKPPPFPLKGTTENPARRTRLLRALLCFSLIAPYVALYAETSRPPRLPCWGCEATPLLPHRLHRVHSSGHNCKPKTTKPLHSSKAHIGEARRRQGGYGGCLPPEVENDIKETNTLALSRM